MPFSSSGIYSSLYGLCSVYPGPVKRPPVPDWDPDESFKALNEGRKSEVSLTTPPLPPKTNRARVIVKTMLPDSNVKSAKKRGELVG